MAKKNGTRSVSSGDVNIKLGDTLIGSLSDNGTATLTCGNKLVESNISVEYTKPAAGLRMATMNRSVSGDGLVVTYTLDATGIAAGATTQNIIGIGLCSFDNSEKIDIQSSDMSWNLLSFDAAMHQITVDATTMADNPTFSSTTNAEHTAYILSFDASASYNAGMMPAKLTVFY